LAQAVQALEARIRDQPKDPAGYAALGDLYLFEADWLSQATGLYETASRLAPDELSYHWRLADLYLNGSRADRFLGELKFLAGRLPGDRPLQDEYLGYVKAYESLGE
jgi:predicted Zn-dependent protease